MLTRGGEDCRSENRLGQAVHSCIWIWKKYEEAARGQTSSTWQLFASLPSSSLTLHSLHLKLSIVYSPTTYLLLFQSLATGTEQTSRQFPIIIHQFVDPPSKIFNWLCINYIPAVCCIHPLLEKASLVCLRKVKASNTRKERIAATDHYSPFLITTRKYPHCCMSCCEGTAICELFSYYTKKRHSNTLKTISLH